MNYSADIFAEQLFGELSLDATATYYIAFSGGVDSTVLLHLLKEASETYGFPMVALHVNHQLQEQSGDWARHCEQLCAELNVPYRQVSLNLESNNEQLARQARYAWFQEQMKPRSVLLTAHHRQDRAETVLFNLMRGAGSAGLSSLRASRPFFGSTLVRPLLNLSRQEVMDIALERQLKWVEDPSNQQDHYSRNHIRQHVLPVLGEFRADAERNIVRAASNLEQENSLLREVAIGDLVEVREHPKHPLDSSHALCFEDFEHLSVARQANLVRFWLNSLQLHIPSKRLLDQLLSAFRNPPASTAVLQEDGFQFRFYRGYMYAMPAIKDEQLFSTINWRDIDQPLDLYKDKIRVDATDKLRALLHSTQFRSSPRGVGLKLSSRPHVANPKALQGHSLNLKKWLQEMGIPPWRRQNLPLLTLSQANKDVVLGPVDQQLHSDWVLLDCPVA